MELITRGNPSVYSLMLVATSPFRGDIINVCLIFICSLKGSWQNRVSDFD